MRVEAFGAFVNIMPGVDGLVHISQLDSERVEKVEDICTVGDELTVMVTDVDAGGKVRLSRQAVLEGWTLEEAREKDKGGGSRGALVAAMSKAAPVLLAKLVKEGRVQGVVSLGVGRWAYDCGCTPGSEWKAPMREAINAIAEWVDEQYLYAFKGLNLQYYENSEYAWEMRHRYIDIMLGKKTVDKLGEEIFGEFWKELDTNKIAILLEAQLERQRMFTSCGWFFDDFNRIEPANNIAYAAKAVWLCMKANNEKFDTSILDLLRKTTETDALNNQKVL